MQAAFEKESCEHWLEALARYRIPAAPVNDLAHAFADPQALARNMTVRVPLADGTVVDEPGNPVKLSDTYEDTYTPPPALGQDTRACWASFWSWTMRPWRALAASGAIGLDPNSRI